MVTDFDGMVWNGELSKKIQKKVENLRPLLPSTKP